MKNRDYKTFALGEHYHIYNRGTGKVDIFKEPADYNFFLSRLEEYLFPGVSRQEGSGRYLRKSFPKGAFSLICYCLMPNHFHLVLRQNGEIPLSALMLSLSGGYSKYFNKRYNRIGAIFQDQFKAVHVDSNEYLLWLTAYIHQNPGTAGLVPQLEEYPYSSYLEYIKNENRNLCDTTIVSEQFRVPDDYKTFVADSAESIQKKKELSHLLLDA